MKKALDVEILGQKITISSDAEEGYMLKVAGYVNDKMQELIQASKPVAKSNAAMLAALNIADELFQERKNASDSFADIERKTESLIGLLDQSLPAGD